MPAESPRSISKSIKIDEASYTNRFNQRQYFAELHIESERYFLSFFSFFTPTTPSN